MDIFLAVIFTLTCIYLMARMVRARDIIDLHLGVIGIFAVGYYCIPVFFKNLSPLGGFSSGDVFIALSIHFVFLIFVIFGTEFGRIAIPKSVALKTPAIDNTISNFRFILAISAFAIYIYYYKTQDLTSYTAANLNAYFNDRGPLFAIIAALGNLSLAFLAVSVAEAWRAGRKMELAIYGGLLGFCVFLALFLGQRLALMTPMMMLLGTLFATGQRKRATRVLGVSVAVLLVISPIAVFVRESIADRRSATAQSAVGAFSYGDNAASKIFQSIVDRSDLLYVTARMKPYIDREPPPGLIYYSSVLLIPIPKVIIPDKPYVLSTSGGSGGELSIWSWRTLLGGTGSLSAFGGLVAYREAGWVGIIFNGLATGVLFTFFGYWLARGGFVARVFYAQLFVLIAVKKVPPSFFEALSEFMGMLPFLVAAMLASRFLSGSKPRPLSLSTHHIDGVKTPSATRAEADC